MINTTPFFLKKQLNWVQSAGINNKKYNPWVGAQLLGVRDQFLIFHPLILLWDLKRIQLFLNRAQSYTKYSLLLVDSRPAIQSAIESFLALNNIPKNKCHVLHFDFPGTLTNQYYISTQANTTSLINSRQIIVFFDYYLNRQFYTESLMIPSIRLSLYSLQNLPINMQYGLPAKTGLLLAIRLLLKLLLKPFFHLQLKSDQYKTFVQDFQQSLPRFSSRQKLHQKTISSALDAANQRKNADNRIRTASWKLVREHKLVKNRFSKSKELLRKRIQSRQKNLLRKYSRFLVKKVKPVLSNVSKSSILNAVRNQTLTKFFSLTKRPFAKPFIATLFASKLFFNRKKKIALRIKKLKILKVRKVQFGKKTNKNIQKAKVTKLKSNKKPGKSLRQGRHKKIKAVRKFKQKSHKLPRLIKMKMSSTNLLAMLTGQFGLQQTKKHLIAKYERTCNIKTQKEWQEIKQKNKLKLEKKKQEQRDKQRKARILRRKKTKRLSASPAKKKNKAQYKRPHWRKSPAPLTKEPAAVHEFLNFKANRRFFSSLSRRLKSRKNAKNWGRRRALPNWVKDTLCNSTYRIVRKRFRQILPTKRTITAWQWYFRFPRAKIAVRLKYSYPTKRRAHVLKFNKRLNYILAKKSMFRLDKIGPNRNVVNNMLCTLPAMRRGKTKSTNKTRILKFRKWYRIMQRISRKRDRRWRQRKWKRAAIRQLRKTFQCVYSNTSVWTGYTYWKRWRVSKSQKSRKRNWRKWRSRYFRRYTRKENLRIQVLFKASVTFHGRTGKYNQHISSTMGSFTSRPKKGLSKAIIAASPLKNLRKISRFGRRKWPDGRLTRRFTKKRFVFRRKLWRRVLRKLPRFLAHRRRVPAKKKIIKKTLHVLNPRLVLSSDTSFNTYSSERKKNYTTQLWFRLYRNTKLLPFVRQKTVSKSFRQLVDQKQLYLRRNQLSQSYWSSHLTIKHLLKFKHATLWNWRLFRNRQRTVEEFKRYVQSFQHTSVKLHKHKVLSIVTSKKLRECKIQKLLGKYKISKTPEMLGRQVLPLFKAKPIRLAKIGFFKFHGKLIQNKNILLGFNTHTDLAPSFLQCYYEYRFWANDNFGPSPLKFWLSPKARRKKTPKQWQLNSSWLNFRLDIRLPNFSCLAETPLRGFPAVGTSLTGNYLNSTIRIKELNYSNNFKNTFKFVINNRERIANIKYRWFWYFAKTEYPSGAVFWQQGLNSTKKTSGVLRIRKARKVLFTHYQKPKSLSNYIAYLLRCNRRRRRRLRERTFKGPTRYRRKYRTHYMYRDLIRLNSHRARYRKPNTRNNVNHYFIRKLVLRRFLRLIYGPKLTNKYFKHFSNLLFVKKFKFWTLYTFFYLRLDFVAILLKFAMNLTWSRQLIQLGLVLVNGKAEKASYSIFLGDVIQLKRLYQGNSATPGQPLDWIRNLAAFAPRVASSLKYQTRLRIPPFFEYSGRIKAGTMFRLPWYFEVRGKVINKENFLLLARGHHSI